MRHLTYLSVGLIAWGSMVGIGYSQQPPALSAPMVTIQPPADNNQNAIAQINSATDPAQVMDAYTRLMNQAPNNVAVMQACIDRLTALDEPQFAEPIAQKLVSISPDNPKAWAVIGVAAAKQGNMPDALADIVYAAVRAPEDPFIQKSAARMIAWYDSAQQKPAVSLVTRAQIDHVRQMMANIDAYTTAYNQAMDFYAKAQAAADNTTSAPASPPLNPLDTSAVAPDDSAYAAPYPMPSYYDDVPAYPAYPEYYSGYCYPYYDGGYPYVYPGVILGGGFGGEFHHFSDFHRGGFRGGERAGISRSFGGASSFARGGGGGHIATPSISRGGGRSFGGSHFSSSAGHFSGGAHFGGGGHAAGGGANCSKAAGRRSVCYHR